MLFRRTQSSGALDYTAGEKVTHFNARERGMNGKNQLTAAKIIREVYLFLFLTVQSDRCRLDGNVI